jgi:hypothetical protein
MYEYIMTGLIYPPRVSFSVEPLKLRISFPKFNISGDAELTITDSNIKLKFYTTDEVSDVETLKNILDNLAIRPIIDCYCFVKSYSYDVDIEKIECAQTGLNYAFSVRGEWNINPTQDETLRCFSRMINLFTHPDLSYYANVFADFRRAIKYPATTASYCYRAIETVRKFGYEDSNNKKEKERRELGWIRLRDELDYQRADFSHIESFATPNRHGDFPPITYQGREIVMNFTRELLNKDIDRQLARYTIQQGET